MTHQWEPFLVGAKLSLLPSGEQPERERPCCLDEMFAHAVSLFTADTRCHFIELVGDLRYAVQARAWRPTDYVPLVTQCSRKNVGALS